MTQTAEKAYELVLADVGASKPKRDEIDARIIDEVRGGYATYGGKWGERKGIIDSQTEVGGWPELRSASPPEDRDRDGMPDIWEKRYGLNPDVADDKEDIDSDGYTNIEEYLNETEPNMAQ
jgi:pectate lyase